MSLTIDRDVVVSRELPDFGGGIEGLMCELKEHYRIGNYLTEQEYEQEWNYQSGRYERMAILKNVWVREDEKGKGHGRELVQWFLDEAQEQDMEAVFLVADTIESNHFDIVEWYASFGFIVIANNESGCPLMSWSQEDMNE